MQQLVAFIACLVLSLGVMPAARGGDSLARYSRSQVHMGVEFEVVLYAASQQEADAAIDRAMARIAALDKALSDYDLESELSKLSASSTAAVTAQGQPLAVKVSDDLWDVLSESQRISAASGGAFDITIGPLTKLWRRARRWKELPDAEALDRARAVVGFQSVQMNATDRTVQLLKPDMRLDLGGIAKGYAANEALTVIENRGIKRALVRASGDIAVADPPPGDAGWRIGIAPLDPDQPPSRFVLLSNAAISTSGDARQHLIVNGRRYSHILDPRTGDPIEGRSSVTVIAPKGTLADDLATAASVLGTEASQILVGKFPGTELLMVHEDTQGDRRTVQTSGFERYEMSPSR